MNTEKLINAEALKEYLENRIYYFDSCEFDFIIAGEKKAYRKIIEIIDKMKDYSLSVGWIPTSERLPEEDGVYLITYLCEGGTPISTASSYIGNHPNYKWWDVEEEYFYFNNVTAWQPLPEPYKGGAE